MKQKKTLLDLIIGNTRYFLLLIFLINFNAARAQQGTFNFTPIADASVYEGNQVANYGNSVILVKDKPNPGIARVAYLKFDVLSTPLNKVGKAVLRLYCFDKGVVNSNVSVSAYSTASDWVENTINYGNAPALGNLAAISVVGEKDSYYEWDITTAVKQAMASGSIFSIALKDDTKADNNMQFYPKESANPNKPQLVIYEEGSGGGSTGDAVLLTGDQQISGNKFFMGNVGIGITTPTDRLAVKGKIRAQEIKVEMTNWPDYVFGKDYALMSLADLEQYIMNNSHLPGIPSAKEAEGQGVDLGAMNNLLLKKIEELTLYLIETDRQIKELSRKVEKLETK